MPRFSPNGVVLNRRREWFDAERWIEQVCGETACKVQLSDGTLLADRGANKLGAGGGKWVGWEKHPEGVFGSITRPGGWAGPGCVGRDGTIAYKVNYHSFGPWRVVLPDGTDVHLTDDDARDVQVIERGKVLWVRPDGTVASTFPLPITGKVWQPPRATAEGDAVWQAQPSGELVLNGRVIGLPADYFLPDVWRGGSALYVIYSPFEGDDEVREMVITDEELAQKPLLGGSEEPIDMTQKQREAQVLEVATQVNADLPHLLQMNTKLSCGLFTEEVAERLHRLDEKWGHVGKASGQNQYNGHAIDAVMYNGPVEVYDFIESAGDETPTKVTSQLKEAGGQPWLDPDDIEGNEPEPEPTPCKCDEVLTHLQGRIAALEDRLVEMIARLDGDVQGLYEDVENLSDDLDTLAEARVKVTARTSREWGHSHTVIIEGELIP